MNYQQSLSNHDKINHMVSWTSLGVICQDSEVDIAPLDWILYVKIVDVSLPSQFSEVVDGFDLDGIKCLNAPSQRMMAVQQESSFSLFPVPVTNNLNIRYAGFTEADVLLIEVFDLTGKSVLKTQQRTQENEGTLEIPATKLSQGQYILSIISSDGKTTMEFLKS